MMDAAVHHVEAQASSTVGTLTPTIHLMVWQVTGLLSKSLITITELSDRVGIELVHRVCVAQFNLRNIFIRLQGQRRC